MMAEGSHARSRSRSNEVAGCSTSTRVVERTVASDTQRGGRRDEPVINAIREVRRRSPAPTGHSAACAIMPFALLAAPLISISSSAATAAQQL